MGGGDLNLKKSWHPSTMKNMEKVWKAEQKHEQEKKKIAELQREIREEREREEIRKFAEDGGVVEKKDEFKLDWMYKGPGGVVSREDYLLGRAIDKSFDLLQESEKETAQSTSAEGRSDQGLPGRSGILDDQVDVARKLQEDPLLFIKKKEMETRSQILNNPVKLKQLQKILKEEKLRERKSKKKSKKKKRKRSSSSSDDEKDLDRILAAKYSRLRNHLNNVDVSKLLSDDENEERRKKEKREVSMSHSQESSGSSRHRHGDSKSHSTKEYGLLVVISINQGFTFGGRIKSWKSLVLFISEDGQKECNGSKIRVIPNVYRNLQDMIRNQVENLLSTLVIGLIKCRKLLQNLPLTHNSKKDKNDLSLKRK
ncbi:pre-mRNA-splicing factor CWC25 homolog isoform X2 [Hetaerina americana]|uniref:pre-mRNA-splicing factor CWC25 homolog isoform X2 n=1 Tax=Hetaerina americana TaxID=62018 RepID=UPI003A7F3F67